MSLTGAWSNSRQCTHQRVLAGWPRPRWAYAVEVVVCILTSSVMSHDIISDTTISAPSPCYMHMYVCDVSHHTHTLPSSNNCSFVDCRHYQRTAALDHKWLNGSLPHTQVGGKQMGGVGGPRAVEGIARVAAQLMLLLFTCTWSTGFDVSQYRVHSHHGCVVPC